NTIQIYSSSAQQFDLSQSTCYHFTDKSMRFVRGLLGNSTQLDRLSGIRATVNQKQACNAFYSLNAMTFFHAAGGCVNTAYNTVVSHEWGHGLDDCFGGIARGQMQEGVADTIPMLMNDDPIVGRDFQGSGTKVRTGTNTRKYPPSGSVHQQGEVWMGWMWDCRTNFVASLGQAKGLDLARELFVGVFPTNPPNQSTGVREIFILDDDDGNLNNGTPHYLDLEKACVKRNMPFPKRTNPDAGSYKTYGMGCKGTGKMPSACGSANTAGLFLDLAGFVNTEYAIEVTASGNLSVSGFEIQSKSRQSGSVTIQTRLYTANAQGQPDQQVRSGTMVIGATPGFYKAQFSSPYQVSNGTKFFIGFLNPASSVSVPIVLTGTPSTVFTKGLIGWGRTLFSFPWSWKLACTGGPGAIPTLTNDGAPELGSSFKLHLESAAANANAVFLIGSSKTRWAGFSLPLDLNPIGAPGCSILAAAEIQIPVTANANGSAVLTLSIPNQASLFRKPFFDQFLIKDTGANRLGWAVSNAGEAKVGKKL
ncbi:MAG: hypothetical protein QF412_08900, partial [Planctomycetota bacterium]|nr:hypothetical protein [Planctomycetota bacterium]